MRIIFAGTPEFAAAHLQVLLEADTAHDIVAVYTQPDRRAGRGKKMLASPVKQLALENSIAIEQPHSLKDADAQQQLQSYNADIMVVVAYGLLLPQAVLDTPHHGCINVHASLLPRWRGAAPVERAIAAGDSETGVTLMQMDAGLDTGPMLGIARCEIAPTETGDSLRDKLIALGGPLLLDVLEQIDSGQQQPQQQDDAQSCYAPKLEKSEARIDWQQSAVDIDRKLRAFTSALGCYTMLGEDRIRIVKAKAIENSNDNAMPGHIALDGSAGKNNQPCLQVSCGVGSLLIDEVQLPGGKAMSIAALLNGKPAYFETGMHFDAQG